MDYFRWVEEILKHLGVTADDIRNGNLPQDWLLRPSGPELSEELASDLFRAIRQWWLGGLPRPYSASDLRERLRDVKPLYALPLLYAMRHVARMWGHNRKYWPEFRRFVLNNEVDLGTVRSIARDLSELWYRFYLFSKGRLFYPREGRANIKWPLSHAGLVSQEEDYLEQFGRMLLAEQESEAEDVPELLVADVDEFQAHLLSWLREQGLAKSAFYRRLTLEEIGLTVAAIAQRELRAMWPRLVTSGSCGASASGWQRRIVPHLRFDTDLGRLTIVLNHGVWSGEVAPVVVEYDGEEKLWPTAYDPSTDRTRASGPIELPVRGPSWAPSLRVRVGDRVQEYPVVPSPFSGEGLGACLFDAATGYRTRTLRPGESYVLLAPQSLLDEASWVEQLFPDRVPLGRPQGRWEGYEAVFVTAAELVDISEDLEGLSEELLDWNAAFRLPSPRDLERPRCRLVASPPLARPRDGIPVFSSEHPPFLEVSGRWLATLEVRLEKQLPGGGFSRVARFELAPALERTKAVIEVVPPGAESAGLYRLSVGDETIEFRLQSEFTRRARAYRVILTLFLNDEPVLSRECDRRFLDEGQFCITAWPGAPLTVNVKEDGSVRRLTLEADEDGQCCFRLSELYASDPPQGRVQVWAESGPAQSEAYVFSDRPYIREWQVSTTPDGVVLEGTVVHAEPGTPLIAAAFGDRPWTPGQMCVARSSVPVGGHVRLFFPISPQVVRYVVVGGGTDKPEGFPWLTARVAVPRTGDWNLAGDGAWDDWKPWMEWLHSHPWIDPEIRDLVAYSRVRRAVLERFGKVPISRLGWTLVGPRLAADLPALLCTTCPPRLALVVSLPTSYPACHPRTSPAGPSPGVEIEREVARLLLLGRVPAEGIRILVHERSSAEARIKIGDLESHRYFLEAVDPLVICRNCGRILPVDGLNHHEKPKGMERVRCNEFRQIPPGKREVVSMAVGWDPLTLADSLAELFQRGCEQGTLPMDTTIDLQEWFLGLGPLLPQRRTEVVEWFRQVTKLAAAAISLLVEPSLPQDGGELRGLLPILDKSRDAVFYVADRIMLWWEEFRT